MKMSKQGAGALLMCLQKCLAEEIDIMPLLEDLNWVINPDDHSEIVCTNPPTFKILESEDDDDYIPAGSRFDPNAR